MTSLLLALSLSADAQATEIGNGRNFGLGIQLGSPSGITGKYYLGGRRNAVSLALGSAYDGRFYNGVWITGSYDFHIAELIDEAELVMPFRVGIGGFLATGQYGWGRYSEDVFLGVRVPFGLDLDLHSAPVQFYLEVAFDMTIYPGIWAGLDAGLGVRYYF